MIFISIALQAEARPLITALRLKRHPHINRFRVYHSPHCVLIVTGTGVVKSAAATSFMLTRFNSTEQDLFLNIGVCGTTSPHIQKGTLFLANRIKDSASGKFMFPDILFAHPFLEAGIETFPVPISRLVSERSGDDYIPELADMEAAGVFEAAKNFVPVHHIAVLKIAIDNLEPESVTPKAIETIMEESSDKIVAWIKDLESTIWKHEDNLVGRDSLYDKALSLMDLSTTLEHEFRQLFHYITLADPEKTSPAHGEIIKIAKAEKKLSRKSAKLLAARLKNIASRVPVPPYTTRFHDIKGEKG